MLWWLVLPSAIVSGVAWMGSSRVYYLDLLVSQQIWLAWWSVLLLAIALCTRRWRIAVLLIVSSVLAFYPIVYGRTMRLPEVDFTTKPEGVIRVVSCNINPENARYEEAMDSLTTIDADVIVLIEVPAELSRDIRNRGVLERTAYEHWAHRAWIDEITSPGFILSTVPIEVIQPDTDENIARHILRVRVAFGSHDVMIGLVHPVSPRTIERWRAGNSVIHHQASFGANLQSEHAAPTIIGADINAGPAQARSRVMRRSGFSMSKPLLQPGGTFPSGNAGVFSVQLDDLWTKGAIDPIAWSKINIPGSDHFAVVCDFEFTAP